MLLIARLIKNYNFEIQMGSNIWIYINTMTAKYSDDNNNNKMSLLRLIIMIITYR